MWRLRRVSLATCGTCGWRGRSRAERATGRSSWNAGILSAWPAKTALPRRRAPSPSLSEFVFRGKKKEDQEPILERILIDFDRFFCFEASSQDFLSPRLTLVGEAG